MARKREQIPEEEEPEINMTPMLDIVFIMLIFFIVTTNFVRETGIDPTRPGAETAEEKARANILVGVDQVGDLWMHQEQIEVGDIRPLVEEALGQNPESSAVVIADERASTRRVIEAMDEVRRAGVEDISVATEGGGGR